MKPSQILRAARQLIIERGHARGSFEDAAGCLCASGAMRCAVMGDPRPYYGTAPDQLYTAREALYQQMQDPEAGLFVWNDSTPTPEVLAAFERAAETLEERGQ